MAGDEEVVEPSTAFDRGKASAKEVDLEGFGYLRSFLGAADVFALSGVVHQCTVKM